MYYDDMNLKLGQDSLSNDLMLGIYIIQTLLLKNCKNNKANYRFFIDLHADH